MKHKSMSEMNREREFKKAQKKLMKIQTTEAEKRITNF